MDKIRNGLLAALPRACYEKLLPALVPVVLVFGDILYEPGKPMRDVYFPVNCLVSLLTLVEGHLALEVGMVGREGMVGVALALGIKDSPMRALVQGAGPALRMSAARFSRELERSPSLRCGVNHYIHELMGQISQTAACNRFHNVESRLARWLLMTRDRMGAPQFRMTQDFLATMLGVRRVGVTESASALQRRKLIEYHRGSIHILDQRGLEAAACSCYSPPPDAARPAGTGQAPPKVKLAAASADLDTRAEFAML
jgi:CRP-like cAMP-binding protein